MVTLPEAGSGVVLRDERGGEYRSSVVTTAEQDLLLEPPLDFEEVEVGTRLVVTWPDRGSVCFLPVVVTATDVVAITPSGPHRGTWQVRVSDIPWREERRRHVRLAIDASLEITYALGNVFQHVSAIVVDLSQAAVRCAVPPEHKALRVSSMPVRLKIDIGSESFDTAGYVLTGRPAAREDLRLEVVILFEQALPGIERLRAQSH